MRLAYLVLAHDKPSQLARLVAALRAEDVGIFVHVDRAAPIEPFVTAVPRALEVEWTNRRADVHWAGFGMVRATLELMSTAIRRGPFDYLALLSGVDYPIVSHARIVSEIARTDKAEFINSRRMPAPEIDKPMSRLDRYFVAPKNRGDRFARVLNQALLMGPPRSMRRTFGTLQPHAGSSWWCLSRACVDYVLAFADSRPDFVKFLRFSRSPDEMFFQTIIANSPFAPRMRPALFYADWTRKPPPYPSVLDSSDLPYLRSSGKLFARKFDLAHDPAVFDLIDQELRRD